MARIAMLTDSRVNALTAAVQAVTPSGNAQIVVGSPSGAAIKIGASRWHANAYGAVNDGSSHPLSSAYGSLAAAQAVYPHAVALTDEIDWAAAQGAVNAAITGGGEVILAAGQPQWNRPLDFSAMKGGHKPVTLQGAGSGDSAGGTTAITATGGTAVITAYGSTSGSDQPIVGLGLRGFRIILGANIGTNYVIDLDYVTAGLHMDGIYVYGNGKTGNGVQVRNMTQGQFDLGRVSVRNFPAGRGFRLYVEATANVGTAMNSGNGTVRACTAIDCKYGWLAGASGNLLNSISFVSPKAVNVSDIAGSIGFQVDSGAELMSFVVPHAERFSTGIQLDGHENTVLSPLTSFPTGTPDANSAGIRISGHKNVVQSLRASQTHYGVLFTGAAQHNIASASPVASAPPLTAVIADQSSNGGNMWQIQNGLPNAIQMGNAQHIYSHPTNAAFVVAQSKLTTDSQGQWRLRVNGTTEWGNGTVFDTTLSRSAANVLQASGAIRVFAAVTGSRIAAATAGSGAMMFDTTLNKPIWSDGTTWRDATGTAV